MPKRTRRLQTDLTHLLRLCAASLLMALPTLAANVNVFAAASLADSLKEIAAAYEKASGDKIIFNLGASSVLARQIEEGAPADLFFSADEAKMDALEKKNLVVKETRRSRLSNALVIVVASDGALPIRTASDLTNSSVRRLALADPKTVPAGLYAKEHLEKAGLWRALEKKVVPLDNVRAALAAVEAGNAQAGIVYKTDAGISKKVKVAHEIHVQDGPAISYPLALLKESRQPAAAQRFLTHLNSSSAARVFEKFGFIVRP